MVGATGFLVVSHISVCFLYDIAITHEFTKYLEESCLAVFFLFLIFSKRCFY